MKVVSPEEERAHYAEVLKGGVIGGSVCLGLGWAGVLAASRRYAGVRNLTLPFRTWLVTGAGTFGAIVNAERHGNAFHAANNPHAFYKDAATRAGELAAAQRTPRESAREWGRRNRYSIVGASWLASITTALAVIRRNRLLSASQKLVQARVYAQALTLLVLIATAAFETAESRGHLPRWDVIKVLDPEDPEGRQVVEKRVHREDYRGQDLWKDMVVAEERRLALHEALTM